MFGIPNADSIDTVDVGYRVNGKRILEGITFSLSRGGFVGIVGPNGAGKTTLVKILVDILKPTSGKIRLAGRETSTYGRKELFQRVAFVPQSIDFSFPLKVLDVVLMGRMPYLGRLEIEGSKDYAIALSALKTVGMEEFAARVITTLSGGEKQLVALAKAIAQGTEFLVLDEPTANLDIYHQLKIMSLLRGLAHGGKGVAIVLHDLRLAAKFCTKVLVLDDGRAVNFGEPAEVLTEEAISEVFKVRVCVLRNEVDGNTIIDPLEPIP